MKRWERCCKVVKKKRVSFVHAGREVGDAAGESPKAVGMDALDLGGQVDAGREKGRALTKRPQVSWMLHLSFGG